MDVSLDTDITIHLYNAGKEELLYKYFDKCYMHEFIIERELKNARFKVAFAERILNDDVERPITEVFYGMMELNNYLICLPIFANMVSI